MQIRRYISLVISFVFTCTSTLAQQTIFKTYTVGNGLVNNSVRKIFQDSKGFLWISTWEGLSKYDGNRFTNFTESNGLSHNLVNDVIEVPNGDIYVAMNNGCVDVISHDKVKSKALFQNVIVNQFYFEQGKLRAFTDNAGIIEFDGNRLKRLFPHNKLAFYNAASANDSTIIAATDPSPFLVYDRSYHSVIDSTVKSENSVSNIVFRDQQGRLWLGTTNGLKHLVYSKEKKEYLITAPLAPFNIDDLMNADVTSIFQQSNGNFWFGTNRGLISISADGVVVKLTEKEGLPSHSVKWIFNDDDYNLWIGTEQGLAKIISNSAIPIPDPSALPPNFASVVRKISSQECLLSVNHFLYRYNLANGRIKIITSWKNQSDLLYIQNSFPFLFVQQDKIWRYDESDDKLSLLHKLKQDPNSLCATSPQDGSFLFGTMYGLVVSGKPGLLMDSFFTMRISALLTAKKGDIWIGTWDQGLYRATFDPLSLKFTHIIHVDQLPESHIRSLSEDKEGNIWVGTRYNGVVSLHENSNHQFTFAVFNQQRGLTSNWVRDVTFDDEGNGWVAGFSGIDKLVRKNNDYAVFNYSKVINLVGISNLIEYLGNRKLFYSTINGVFEITDGGIEKQKPLPVQLTKIFVGKNELTDFETDDSNIVVPYTDNHASFEFTTTSYLNESEILYSYRLRGSVDTAWSVPSKNHSIQFASLEPGKYTFEVRMLSWDGSFGPATDFQFSIKHPYWKTWWFYAAIIAITIALLYGLYRYRIRQLLKLQKMRSKIATDLHDDIGSTLTNIGILSELSKKNLQQTPVAEKYLQRITEESVASQQALDDIIWSVNTRNDNTQELQARMRRYVAEVFESSNIACQFSFEDNEGGRLNMEQRRDLYLVFKECLNNIHKHAGAKNILIRIILKNGVLKLLIKDDGKGFDPHAATDRNGLKNLKIRVEKWKGSLKIDTAPGEGSVIEIIMPVKIHYSNEW